MVDMLILRTLAAGREMRGFEIAESILKGLSHTNHENLFRTFVRNKRWRTLPGIERWRALGWEYQITIPGGFTVAPVRKSASAGVIELLLCRSTYTE